MAPKEPEGPGRPSAAPPPCPRCELVKSQVLLLIVSKGLWWCRVHASCARMPAAKCRRHSRTRWILPLQCTKTVINYQKSHRKKVEALRSELKASRQREQRLQRQLRFYKATFRLVPGAAIVAAVGWFIARRLRRSPVAAASEEADAGAAAKAGDGGAGASAEAASSAQPEEAAVATA